ncbi:MAG: UDP-3-O-(3-hydroxymyristoyl)glucosamine N-acyltransferase [Planctomycetota bacterium]|jgi:UDP-3-O-[3-hydroxymyristoyl] glucosamine N-acyltransferase
MKLTIAQLAEHIGAELNIDSTAGQNFVTSVGTVEAGGEDTVTFITGGRLIPKLKNSRAGAVIVDRRIEGINKPQLIVKDVNKALIEALRIFAPKLKAAVEGIDSTAKIGENVKIAKGISVGAGAVIDDGVQIGEGSIIGSGCKIGEHSKVGKSCRLDSNVVVYHNCTIGDNVIIQANTTIGSTGFGYTFIDGRHQLIPHNGVVVIEDFVEIGANCCIDRAKFGETRIGAGTKIDNLVQIAHNVIIGKCCLIAGQVGIAGSCKLGDGVVLAGQVGLADNIEIEEGTKVGAQAGVTRNIGAGQQVFGSPAVDSKEAAESIVLMRRLPKLVEGFKQLSKRVEKLEAADDDKD